MLLWMWVYKSLFKTLFSLLLDIYSGVELLNRMVILCLSFWGTSVLFSTVAACFHVPTKVSKDSNFSTSSPTPVVLFLENFLHSSRSDGCETASHCGLICIPGRSPGEGNGNPLQYCLQNPMDRGAWWATVHGIARLGHDWVTKPPPVIRNAAHVSLSLCPFAHLPWGTVCSNPLPSF